MDDIKEIKDTNEEIENNLEEITSLVGESNTNSQESSKKDKEEKQIEFKLDNLNLSKSNVINILEDLRVIKKRFNHIENIIKEAERAQYGPSRDLPGITGIYNGDYMVSSDGQKHDVPKNYAAKSLLVNGDELKMMEQDGKVAFKIVNKVPRKKIEGLLSKKDGRYVILSDSGTFNLLKTAVEFRNIKQGEWVLAVIPETGSANNFAAVDKIIKKESKKEVKFYDKPKSDSNKSQQQPKQQNNSQSKVENKPQAPKPQPPKPETPKPQGQSPLPKIQFSDDDLV
jgi:hypothetical protein